MDSLFGLPMQSVAWLSATLTFLALTGLLVAGLRRGLLVRLAIRNPRRRPAQALLITLGLTLSTVIVGTALNTGDTMTHTVRSLVASSLGRADEVVLALPRDQRRSPAEYVGALLSGTLLTGLGGYFPEEQAARLREATAADARIEGLLPAISEQVTVVNLDAQAIQSQISLLAVPPDYPPAFGVLKTSEGEDIGLEALGPSELLANSDAAALLGLQDGVKVELRLQNGGFPFTVRAVVERGPLGGSQPTLYTRLGDYQQLAGRAGRINQILVANRGENNTSVRLSSEVSRTLRLALADREAAARLFELLSRDAVRAEIAGAARTSEGRQREKLSSLSRSLEASGLSDDFINLASDPDVERRLVQIAGRVAGAGALRSGQLEISPLRVLEIKQASQDQADRWGGVLTSTFLILGLFSLATGALLVFLIFITLAAERRSELGVARALGARRRDIVLMFLLEGIIYDLIGSAIGLGLGVLLALQLTAMADGALGEYGVRLQPFLDPRSLIVSYCLGLLLTLLTVGCSAWYISRLSVVNAIKNLPDPPRRHRARARIGLVGLLAGALLLIWLGLSQRWAFGQAGGVGLLLVGLGLTLRLVLGRIGSLSRLADWLAFTVAGLALLAYWLAPPNWPIVDRLRPTPTGVDFFFIAGLSMVLGAVCVLVYNLGALSRPLLAISSRSRAFGIALRTALSSPLEHRLRTGMILAMFSLVIFSMVVSSVLLTATHRAYDDPELLSGGFDVKGELARPAEAFELEAALEQASAVRRDDFAEAGRLASRPGQVLELSGGARRWMPYTLHEIDQGFVAGLRAPLAARADGLRSDAEVWELVSSASGHAVASGSAVGPRLGGAGGFRFAELFSDTTRFAPTELWVRDERGGRASPLKVVGVLDPRVSFPGGLYTSRGTLEAATTQPAQRVAFYLKARPGADPATLALGLNISLAERGLQSAALGQELRMIQSVRSLLNQLLQGFFGVGLLAGLAALGVVSLRSVVERRQQIGVLRALGYRRQMVRLSFLLETSLIALLGIGLGVGLGLALAQRLIEFLGRQNPEILFSVPWPQLGLIGGGAYLASLALTLLPVWQIGRIEPATALRYE